MLTNLVSYGATLVVFFLADMAWLSVMAPRVYRPILGDIALSGVNLPPAILFYAIYPAGLVVFAIHPALKSGSISTASVYGALFGFFTYATYDLTNQATLRNWSLQLTFVDVVWGTILGAISASIGVWFVTKVVSSA